MDQMNHWDRNAPIETAAPLVLGRHFTLEERKELLRDNRRIAKIVQVPMKNYPETLEEFDEYFDDFIENKLTRHPVAVELIEQMQAAPPVPREVPKAIRPAVKAEATASRSGWRRIWASLISSGMFAP